MSGWKERKKTCIIRFTESNRLTQMNEGPSLQTINEKYYTCIGCKYLERVMMKSGKRPVYSHHCKHVEKQDRGFNDLLLRAYGGNIGISDRTPSWCPILSKVR